MTLDRCRHCRVKLRFADLLAMIAAIALIGYALLLPQLPLSLSGPVGSWIDALLLPGE